LGSFDGLAKKVLRIFIFLDEYLSEPPQKQGASKPPKPTQKM